MPSLITVWRIPLNASDDMLAQLQVLLSDQERRKTAQFKSDIHRRRHVVRHAAMRLILSRETQRAPNELHFVQASFGKPSLGNPFGHVQFSLTHSAEMALLAVCPDGAVGIDIEAQRPLVDLEQLVTQICSPTEARVIMDSADAEQMFYRCWVGKEAVLKCLGLGLSVPVNDLEVLDAQGHLMTSPLLPLEWSEAGTVHLHPLDDLPPGFVGAVAVRKNDKEQVAAIEVRMRDWAP